MISEEFGNEICTGSAYPQEFLTKYCRGPQRKSLGDMDLDEGDTGSPSHVAHAHGFYLSLRSDK